MPEARPVTPGSGGHGTMRGEGYSHHTLLYQNKTYVKTKPKVGVKYLSKNNKGQKGDYGGRAFASRKKKLRVAAFLQAW